MTNSEPISLLIIDDNEDFLKTFSIFLKENFSREILVLGTASSGPDGVNLAKKHQPQVVLLDLKMPEMHGFDVIPLLRKAQPALKIITTTLLPPELLEQAGEIYRKANLDAGADAFLPKSQLTHDLLSVIQNLNITKHELMNHSQAA